MKKEKEFIKLNMDILTDSTLTPNEKIIIAYIQSFQDNNIYLYQNQKDISIQLGMGYTTLKDSIKSLINKKRIFLSQDRKYLIPFNNRKAIIYVDSNNPLPTEEEIKETSSTTPKVIKEDTSNPILDIKEEIRDTSTEEMIYPTREEEKVRENEDMEFTQEEIDEAERLIIEKLEKKYNIKVNDNTQDDDEIDEALNKMVDNTNDDIFFEDVQEEEIEEEDDIEGSIKFTTKYGTFNVYKENIESLEEILEGYQNRGSFKGFYRELMSSNTEYKLNNVLERRLRTKVSNTESMNNINNK